VLYAWDGAAAPATPPPWRVVPAEEPGRKRQERLRDRRPKGPAIYLRHMGETVTRRDAKLPDRRGLPVVVALAIFVVVISGLVGNVALLGAQHAVWSANTAWILLRVSEGLACVGLAFSLLAAALTRPPLGYRGFVASVSSAITAGCIVWLILWWHARMSGG